MLHWYLLQLLSIWNATEKILSYIKIKYILLNYNADTRNSRTWENS